MRFSDDNARRLSQASRPRPVDLRLALGQASSAVPWRRAAAGAALPAAVVLETARRLGAQPGSWLVGGGEPLERGDLGELLAGLTALRPQLGLCSAGRGLTAALAQRLREAGVGRLHVPFHCARQDAHDWLVGEPGALKTALRAIRACAEAALPVHAEVMLTRPTAAHLAETVEVLARVGVRTITLRRLSAHEAPGADFVPLSPRLELLAPHLEDAAAVALERRTRLLLRDLPLCVAPRLRPLFAAPDSELWVQPDGQARRRAPAGLGCATCPGAPHCAGAPPDYVARFGWEEFRDAAADAARVDETVEAQQAPPLSAPLVFGWRGPQRVRCEACGDARDGGTAAESTRVVRARLVEAARWRPAALRLIGADLLAHPSAAALVYDAVRLFPHVEVAGEASPVVDWSDVELRRIKELQRFDAPLYGPDAATHDAHCGIPGAFAATLRGLARVRARTSIAVGTYAVLHDARLVAPFADAWQRGELPGAPRFRLSAAGGALDELLDAARALPSGAARNALLAVLPHCRAAREGLAPDAAGAPSPAAQYRIESGRRVAHPHPCGADPFGAFTACQDGPEPCAHAACPGTAVGWRSTTRTTQWTASI